MEKADYDLVIIGGGPAGLTAGLYAARARMKVILLEKITPGGQILITDWIENYPGFPEGISGAELVQRMTDQAKRFDLSIQSAEVSSLDLSKPAKRITLSDGGILLARAVIIATGASPKKLGVPGEAKFSGRGVSFCGTCDGPFFKDRVVAAVGGGDTAVQESQFLTKFARKVFLIHRRDELRAEKILQERAFANKKIELVWDSVVTEIAGLTHVEKITIKHVKTNETKNLPVDGCFIWIGTHPNVDFLGDELLRDDNGFIITDTNMATSISGVFAAGDVRNTPIRQIATAAGDAVISVAAAENYLESV
ncbi:MAG: thioredoxin-disulfide reductase [Desulfobacterales bacterium]